MDKKCNGSSTQIQTYIKNRSKIGHSAKSNNNEIVIKQFQIGSFADGQSNSVMGENVLKIDQGRVKESVRLPKIRSEN